MDIYKTLSTRATALGAATIPGDSSPGPGSLPGAGGPRWRLHTMQMPPARVIETLLSIYFRKMHWFIWIFHEPSFMADARRVLSAPAWHRRDMSKVLVTLTVAAVGLKCANQDTSPRGQELLASLSPEPQKLLDQMVAEVRLHLLDLLDDNCIETVQVCLLLSAFYIFHGSASLGWVTIGLTARAAYALELHCPSHSHDPVADQVRRRCWNHLTVADTFASQIYGRPATLDPAFSELLPLSDIDDTPLDLARDRRGRRGRQGPGPGPGPGVSASTFHWLKYKLYAIIMETLSTFRLLRLHSPLTADELQSLLDAVARIEARLAEWRRDLPPLLDSRDLSEHGQEPGPHGPGDAAEDDDNDDNDDYDDDDDDGNDQGRDDRRRLRLQACHLQVVYNSAIILAHRPLLESSLSPEHRQGVPEAMSESVSRSFDASIRAALRISRTPIMLFRDEFCMAFMFVHLFTAGVILCIPPTTHPYSLTAQESRAGVFRIIQAAKSLSQHSQIARHTERLLGDLLRLSLHREVDMVFRDDRKADPQPARGSATPQGHSGNGQVQGHVNGNSHAKGGGVDVWPEPPDVAERDARVTISENDALPYMPMSDPAGTAMGDEWIEPRLPSDVVKTDGFDMQGLDLPLDEAFSTFGQGESVSPPSNRAGICLPQVTPVTNHCI